MGFILIELPNKQTLTLGDAVGQNRARREMGQSHYDSRGNHIDEAELRRREEKAGF